MGENTDSMEPRPVPKDGSSNIAGTIDQVNPYISGMHMNTPEM